ncbi:MAG: PHP domain-containing protein [Betaproteobacteria bacterium]|nr:PHP domain-containing protein [Betaproteobacteria bacterium]MDH5222706.1 PHP domain-containing protein [Betaproteobacteria bacterium]MDH5352325.1 PHP domain-containing protein [Betaproteobacteria bacterium]
MNFDLHCHSNVSDGALPPAQVARRAARAGVEVWALTDHDQLGGLDEARAAARAESMRFVDGVEISVTWRGSTIHIVGLRIDPADPSLVAALERVRGGRVERARQMARDLQEAGVAGAFDGAMRHAEHAEMIARTHFARFLVEAGVVADMREAFRRFLVPGKPGYVPHQWAVLADAVHWIRAAGGQAVLAHPGRYGLSAGAMAALLEEFRAAGGEALEVVTGSHSSEQMRHFGALATRHQFAASRGSDFHGPEEGAEFGSLPPLDPALRPVWRDWAL